MMNLKWGCAIWSVVALALSGAVAVIIWQLMPTNTMGFANDRTVSMAEYAGPSPAGVPSELRSASLIVRGAYLVKAGDCVVCHTAPGGQPFAGGLSFPTPFGVLYSPNITPDPQTGVGAWSDQDFTRALHRGIARNGQRLYPAFPFESYTLLSDDDVLAIKAYLFSLPAVRTNIPGNDLVFPFNQRWLMGVWSALYNPSKRFRPHPDRSPEWNRGAYLAEALGHCGDCHTPRNLAQAPDNRRKYRGSLLEGWRAYNITQDAVSGLGSWDSSELVNYLHSGHAPGHGSAGGPMAEEVDNSLMALAPSDIRAIAVYLHSIPGLTDPRLPAPRSTPAPDTASSDEASHNLLGKHIFAEECASCHAWSGVSPLTPYATLTGARSINDPSAINVVQMIISGAQRLTSHGMDSMPSFGAANSDNEIAAVANYVTSRFGAAPSRVTAKEVARLRQLTAR